MAIYGNIKPLDVGVLVESLFQETKLFYHSINESNLLLISEGAFSNIFEKVKKAWGVVKKFVVDKVKWLVEKILGIFKKRNTAPTFQSGPPEDTNVPLKLASFKIPLTILDIDTLKRFTEIYPKLKFALATYSYLMQNPVFTKGNLEDSKELKLELLENCKETIDKDKEEMSEFLDFFHPRNFPKYLSDFPFPVFTGDSSVEFRHNLNEAKNTIHIFQNNIDMFKDTVMNLIDTVRKTMEIYETLIKDYETFMKNKQKEYDEESKHDYIKDAALIKFKMTEMFAYSSFKDFEFGQKFVEYGAQFVALMASMYQFIDKEVYTVISMVISMDPKFYTQKTLDRIKIPKFSLKEAES